MIATPLFNPADFHIPPGVTHVCAGGEPATLKRQDDAAARYFRDKSAGMPGRTRQEAEVERVRAAAARLWHFEPGDIGFVSNVAEGVAIIAESLDWRDGDNICIDQNEYPSVVGPAAMRRYPPVALRIATGQSPTRVAELVDGRTRIIGVSYVSYLTGERTDLVPLREQADRVGAILVVDFTQATGYQRIHASIADFAFSACYKWLLGVTGTAIAYWNRARQPNWGPVSAGWQSFAAGTRQYDPLPELRADAMRFTRGNPSHASVYALGTGLDYLAAHDMAALRVHVQGLTVALLDRFAAMNVPVMTPADSARHGASVCVASSDALAIVDDLHQHGVWAWNGHGRIRFSFHGYNCLADVDRIAEAVRQVWR